MTERPTAGDEARGGFAPAPGDRVVLIDDRPEYGLRRGEVGTVVGRLGPGLLSVAVGALDGSETAVVPLTTAQVAAAPPPPTALQRARSLVAGHRRLAAALGGVLLLAVAVSAGWLLWRPAPAPPALYAASANNDYGAGAGRLRRLDPVTLDEAPVGGGLIRLSGDPIEQEWVRFAQLPPLVAGDGALWVKVEVTAKQPATAADYTIVLREGPFGREKARLRPPVPLAHLMLSRDGRRLVALTWPGGETGDGGWRPLIHWQRWWVLDTATGLLRYAVDGAPPAGMVVTAWLSADGLFLHRLEAPGLPAPHGPSSSQWPALRPPRLVTLDVATGLAVGQVELTEALAGATASGEHRWFWPGAAVTDDGRRLAVVHADAPRVTLVDVTRLAVAETFAFTRAAHLPSPDQRWRSLTDPSEVRGLRRARFAPDGRHLYLWGWGDDSTEADGPDMQFLGLGRLDLQGRQLVAEGFVGQPFDDLVPARDGGGVYLLQTRGMTGRWPWLITIDPYLRRLDAHTLEVQAQRWLPGHWHLAWISAPAADAAGLPLPIDRGRDDDGPGDDGRVDQARIEGEAREAALAWLALLGTRPAQPARPSLTPDDRRWLAEVSAALGLDRPVERAVIRASTVDERAARFDIDIHLGGEAKPLTLYLEPGEAGWRVRTVVAAPEAHREASPPAG
jgi:hypothetical protein